MNFLNKNLLLVRNLGRISYPKFIDVQNGIKINYNNSDKNILLMAEHQSPLFLFSTTKKNQSNSTTINNNDIINDAKYNKLKQLGYDVCKVTKSIDSLEIDNDNNDTNNNNNNNNNFNSNNNINSNNNNNNNNKNNKNNNNISNNQIIWHGPGQLTVYPILSSQFNIDKNQYKMKLEKVVLKCLDQLSIKCKIENNQIKTINNNEIIGDIKIFNDFYKVPGFSLNINPNIGICNEINNVGNISSISRIINSQMITVADVVPIVSRNFLEEFELEQIDPYNYYLSQYNDQFINNNYKNNNNNNNNDNNIHKITNNYYDDDDENQLNSNDDNNILSTSSFILNNNNNNNSNNNNNDITTDNNSLIF
ncbi:hypothetical protein DDB_G0275417 [Dictyostelium discoideum AX4]|uniref:BPL/LPL catalytic domain-containing protein n=1 Tax=Dictyostelium discoideum TaxID=44689 RepID=Q553T7_DICDI|nr:hypothetical protein DDB_G0275417 [Dictyostelium discoideum AX4]EAL69774.1 hypothetical protein DDB_G0275417 [Dictyostelium discoideum AX4]|eukprot:XP_643688.1 hypothetical protein DDB_G0275417 [Dictyostelium discoideum AX4]